LAQATTRKQPKLAKSASTVTTIGLGILSRALREAALYLFGAVAIYLFITLLSYHPDDPGWSHSVAHDAITNVGGLAGAWVADILLYSFGYMAYLVPLMVGHGGWLLFRGPSGPKDPKGKKAATTAGNGVMVVRTIGLLLTLGAGSGLALIHFNGAEVQLPLGSGGMLGQAVGNGLLLLFSSVGATIFLLALFLTGVTLFTGLSWVQLMDTLGGWVLSGCKAVGLGAWGLTASMPGRIRDYREQRANAAPLPEVEEPAAPEPEAVELPQATLDLLRGEPRRERVEPRLSIGALAAVVPAEPVAAEPPLLSAVVAPSRNEPPPPPVVVEPEPPVLQPEETLSPPWIGSTAARDTAPVEVEPPTLTAAPKVVEAAQPTPVAPPAIHSPTIHAPVQRPTPARVIPQKRALPGLPPLELLDPPEAPRNSFSSEVLERIARLVEVKLKDFGVVAQVEEVHPGPVITRFELQLAPGTKVSQVTNLSKDLARALSAIAVRVVEVIPGKTTIGLEVPNEKRETVRLVEGLKSAVFQKAKSPLTVALGHDIAGNPVVADLADMPHLLVAGTTGSGKSVGVNAMILSLLYRATPKDVRLIMVDPKMLELSIYEGIPHLLAPVVTDMKDAANALRWCVAEMERRYKLMASMGVRNLAGFNKKICETDPIPDPFWQPPPLDPEAERPMLEELPYIVVIVDELADLMMVVGKKVEELIARLAQKARASGIHLILATQRPSVDVITGLIKANIPTRIAFQVSSRVDSRTILDQQGAEALLGKGDMLYLPKGAGTPVRVHGAFVADQEVHNVCEFLREQGEPDYVEGVLEGGGDAGLLPGEAAAGGGGNDMESDPLFDEAIKIVTESRRASVSGIQRRLKIGYNRAARLVETMERIGVVGPLQANGAREVLAPPPVE